RSAPGTPLYCFSVEFVLAADVQLRERRLDVEAVAVELLEARVGAWLKRAFVRSIGTTSMRKNHRMVRQVLVLVNRRNECLKLGPASLCWRRFRSIWVQIWDAVLRSDSGKQILGGIIIEQYEALHYIIAGDLHAGKYPQIVAWTCVARLCSSLANVFRESK